MKNIIEHLNQQIKGEADRISSRVAELQQSNVTDHEVLNTYVERFAHAVQDELGEKELARLETQRNEALKRVEQNEEIIRILTSFLKRDKGSTDESRIGR